MDGRGASRRARGRGAARAVAVAVTLAALSSNCVRSSAAPGSSGEQESSPPAASKETPAEELEDEPAPAAAVEIGGARFTVIYDGRAPVPEASIEDWIRRSATLIAEYYSGDFPVPDLEITITPSRRSGVGFGQHWDGKWLRITVGEGTTPQDFEHDWVMVHEMLHACFPDLERRHRWMQEGLSTYLEPIARARGGNVSDAWVWSKWVRMMHNGRPGFGDRGLDRTHTWGRVYWGGALFWLMVDLEIRQQSKGAAGLEHALRGIVAAGGNGRVTWSTDKVIELGDAATKTTALRDVYTRMADAPGDVELDALWARLGVLPQEDGTVEFNDDAPLAAVRQAMTRAPDAGA